MAKNKPSLSNLEARIKQLEQYTISIGDESKETQAHTASLETRVSELEKYIDVLWNSRVEAKPKNPINYKKLLAKGVLKALFMTPLALIILGLIIHENCILSIGSALTLFEVICWSFLEVI